MLQDGSFLLKYLFCNEQNLCIFGYFQENYVKKNYTEIYLCCALLISSTSTNLELSDFSMIV